MYEIIIRDYVNKLTEKQIIDFGKRKNIDISDHDAKILYLYAKNYWKVFYRGDPTDLIVELKEKLDSKTFNVLYKLYIDLKSKSKN